jgi:Leucine-rich repeat (LRR) protein
MGLLTEDCLQGLKYMTNLTSLSLYGTQNVDLSLLSGLTNLRSLDLRFTGIRDTASLSALTGLTNLWSLNLESNYINVNHPIIEELRAMVAVNPHPARVGFRGFHGYVTVMPQLLPSIDDVLEILRLLAGLPSDAPAGSTIDDAMDILISLAGLREE